MLNGNIPALNMVFSCVSVKRKFNTFYKDTRIQDVNRKSCKSCTLYQNYPERFRLITEATKIKLTNLSSLHSACFVDIEAGIIVFHYGSTCSKNILHKWLNISQKYRSVNTPHTVRNPIFFTSSWK